MQSPANKKTAGNKGLRQYINVFPYDGIIRIRSQVEVIAKSGLPLSLSFIKLPKIARKL